MKWSGPAGLLVTRRLVELKLEKLREKVPHIGCVAGDMATWVKNARPQVPLGGAMPWHCRYANHSKPYYRDELDVAVEYPPTPYLSHQQAK